VSQASNNTSGVRSCYCDDR